MADEPAPPPAAVETSDPDEGPIVEIRDAEATQSLPARGGAGRAGADPSDHDRRTKDRGDGDPSLRELFWGEEE